MYNIDFHQLFIENLSGIGQLSTLLGKSKSDSWLQESDI